MGNPSQPSPLLGGVLELLVVVVDHTDAVGLAVRQVAGQVAPHLLTILPSTSTSSFHPLTLVHSRGGILLVGGRWYW